MFYDLSFEQVGKIISLALDAMFVVRFSKNPTAYVANPDTEQFLLISVVSSLYVFIFVCFVFAISDSARPEDYKTTHIVSNSFSILLFLLFSLSVMYNYL